MHVYKLERPINLFDQIQIEFQKHKSVKHNLDYHFINVTRQNIHAWVHKRPHKNKHTLNFMKKTACFLFN